MTPSRTVDYFDFVLQTQGVAAAIAFLNAGVPHRYTGVYRLGSGGIFQNIFRHDKTGDIRPEFLPSVPMEDSFCQFVLRDGLFRTNDSALDCRLDGQKYQGAVVGYHGVPIPSHPGELWGTLCHFDVVQLELPDAEFDLLERAARKLPRFLQG